VRVGSAQLFSLKRCGADSPLPFPDSVMLLIWVRIDRFKVKPLLIQDSEIRNYDWVMH
jgi:hypothetical protein